jgi:hypothetical protein
LATALLTAEREHPIRRAASEKLPASTTRAKIAIRFKSAIDAFAPVCCYAPRIVAILATF